MTVGVLLAGGAVVSTAPTYLKCSNLFQHCQGVQLSQLHQPILSAATCFNCSNKLNTSVVFALLVQLRQLHPLRGNLFQLLQQTEHLCHFCFVGAVETTAPP